MTELPDFIKLTSYQWEDDSAAGIPTGNSAIFEWDGTANGSATKMMINGEEYRRNLARNPQGISAIGWTNNNSSTHNKTNNFGIASHTPHPLGLTRAVRSINAETTSNALWMYNIDGLSNISEYDRHASVWVLALFDGATARLGSTGPYFPVPRQTWTKIYTTDVVTANTRLYLAVTAPSPETSYDLEAQATGLMVWEDGTPEPELYFDGSTESIVTSKTVTPAQHSTRIYMHDGEMRVDRNLINQKMDTEATWLTESKTDHEFVDKGDFHVPGWTGDTLLRLTTDVSTGTYTSIKTANWRSLQWGKYYAMSIWVRTEQALLSTDFYTVFRGDVGSELEAPPTWYSVKRETLPGGVQRFTISGKIPILTLDRQQFAINGRAYSESPMDVGPMMYSGPHDTEAEALAAVENYFDGDTPYELELLPWTPSAKFDNPKERVAEYGVDRGILYLNDNVVVPWNGLIRVAENIDDVDIQPYYVDGVKRLDVPSTFQIEGEIEAYSAPREFAAYVGEAEIAPGFYGSNQMPRPFSVSYRTRIGGQNGSKHYKIHILYNVLAQPADKEYNTIGEDTDPSVFTWEFKTTPQVVNGIRSSLFTLDSREISMGALAIIESRLYGYDQDEPELLTPDEISAVIADYPL